MKIQARRCGAVTVVLAMLIVGATEAAQASNDPVKIPDQVSNELAMMVQSAVQERNQQVVTGSNRETFSVQVDRLFSPRARSKVHAEYAELKARKERLNTYGEQYTASKSTFETRSMNISGDTATSEIIEFTELAYASGPPESYRYEQIVHFSKTGSQWTIDVIEAKEDDGIPPSTVVSDEQIAHATKAPLRMGPGLKAIPASPTPKDGKTSDAKSEVPSEPGQVNTFAAGYNYGAMTSYARTWAYGRNPVFRQFGNDCQNFVSQSLHAGGWVEQPGWYLSDAGWWYIGPNQSRPWVNAQSFHNFAVRNGRVSYLNYLNDLGPADVLQVHWEGTPDVDHSMIVTYSPWSAGARDIRVSYHTNDTLNRSVWNLYSSFPYATWYALRT